MPRRCYVYMMTNASRSSLYMGFTNDLRQRLTDHREGFSEFTTRYRINRLVHFELHEEIATARHRERQLKRWRRAWKEELINSVNPDWRDLDGHIPFD